MDSFINTQSPQQNPEISLVKPKSLKTRVKALLKRPQPAQRTPEWYLARQTMITASEASSCLFRSKKHCEPYVKEFGLINFKYKNTDPLNPYETREDYIIKKASSFYGEYSYKDTVYTMWGKKFEDAASRLYCKLYNVKLHEFGLVPHAKIKWLAASPDGITEDGIMLEIKCPKSRKIDTTCIPLYYWIQVQIQLEVCNLEHCDFIECELEEFKDEIEFLNKDIKNGQDFGVTIQIPNTEKDPKFIYPPPSVQTKQEYLLWRDTQIQEYQISFPNQNISVTYYFIAKYNVIRINRSKEWFSQVKDDIKSTWDIIQNLQKDKENYIKYKDSIFLIKNKEYLNKYNITECNIHNDNSTFIFQQEQTHINENEQTIENKQPKKIDICLIDD